MRKIEIRSVEHLRGIVDATMHHYYESNGKPDFDFAYFVSEKQTFFEIRLSLLQDEPTEAYIEEIVRVNKLDKISDTCNTIGCVLYDMAMPCYSRRNFLND
jgi:hypothetical protein